MTFDTDKFRAALRAAHSRRIEKIAPDEMAGDPSIRSILSELRVLEDIVAALDAATAHDPPPRPGRALY